ncbi:hypothetical protein [Herbaspirillum sp.]|uniref:hypothetical protein n=1 Tax=Herbaspirillum sp. TaxID=1890675 RepID=UPI00257E5133|nr:hypothetical protein [Herbaspirillum sp.]
MKPVNAVPVPNQCTFRSSVDITQVRFEWGELAVTLTSGGDRKVVIAKFDEVVGFRVLEEGDLLEFWPVCSSDNGWLFQVLENGWFDLEAIRSGFLREKGLGISEYFIASQNSCISVLSGGVPSIEFLSI